LPGFPRTAGRAAALRCLPGSPFFRFLFLCCAQILRPFRRRFHDAPVDEQLEFSFAFLAALQECGAAVC